MPGAGCRKEVPSAGVPGLPRRSRGSDRASLTLGVGASPDSVGIGWGRSYYAMGGELPFVVPHPSTSVDETI